MSTSHFFNIEENQMSYILQLFKNKINGQYYVLSQSNGFSDIAQWSDKYQDIRIICVRTERLDTKKEL